ncbi:MAG: adenylate/guanylate cyclase domain-containing protein, partial [Treponema sp.]|nr:adenylate/guanylate cyclase domain-containing protein [Treponema sp.]
MQVNKKKTHRLIKTGLAVFAAVCFLHVSGALDWIEHKAYDSRMYRTADAFSPSEEIAVVLLDQDSLDWAKVNEKWGWPWPRESYAKIIDFFHRGHAASVAFDMLYTEPSVYGIKDDKALADACERAGNVVLTVYYDDSFENPLYPVEPIASSATILANVTSTLDSDGYARRSRFYASSKKAEPGLAVASLQLSDELSFLSDVPRAKDGGMYVRFQRDLTRFAPYNAAQIIASEEALERAERDGVEPDFSGDLIDPATFEGMHVFFGLYAPGLFDICTSPVSAVYPGVGVHICQLDTILEGRFLKDSSIILVLMLILMATVLGIGLGAVFNQIQLRKIIAETVLFVLIVCFYIVGTYWIFVKGLILPVVAPVLAFVGSFIISVAESYIIEGRQRRYLKSAFRQYLSPAVIDSLIENPNLLKLGGERREITAFFSDIQGFTTISEGLSPEQLTQFLNMYLSAMSDIILAHGGTIDKYEGDAIIAFWNAPTYQNDHAKRAVEAALECQQKLKQMQSHLIAITRRPVKQRIGLNTGVATVGNFGSNKRFDYTMMGDAVNLASRLEGINKQFGTYTMCSEQTMKRASEAGCQLFFRNIANIVVVGRREPVRVYTPMEQSEAKA